MRKIKSRILAFVAAVVLLIVTALGVGVLVGAPASAAGPVSASNATYSTGGGTGVYARLNRTSATLTASSGSYTNLTGTSYWNISEDGGFTFDSSGIHVPADGVYELSWNAIGTSAGSAVCGFALDDQTPNGGILVGIGPIVNLAASVGNGSSTLVLSEGTVVDFWCYGSGGSISLQDSAATSLSVVLVQ